MPRLSRCRDMKRCLLWYALMLSACAPEKKAEKVAPPPASSAQLASARVDAALMHDYEMADVPQGQERGHPPLPAQADDATFLRRACIDLAGRLPRADEARAFLADPSADKRGRLTDALTLEPGAAEVRYRMLAEAFRVKDDAEVITWLRKAAAEDRPYADIIRHMIGGGKMRQRDGGNALRTSVETAYTVLGEDLYCAMCHDHPFNDHTQHECYSFAACFVGKNKMRLPFDYLYADGKPGEVVPPALLRLAYRHQHYIRDNEDNLEEVAKWLVADGAKRYALVASLRVWSGMFGMPGMMVDRTIGGLDDAPPWHGIPHTSIHSHIRTSCFSAPPRATSTWVGMSLNSATDFSQATRLLTEEFERCGGRIGEFQRILARTHAYGRTGHAPGLAWNGCYLVPAPQIRRLPSEVIWKAVSGETDKQIPQVPAPGHPLRMLGRGTREWADESLTPVSHALARFMISHPAENAAHAAASADELFLTLLGRQPEDAERAAIARNAASPQEIAWALLNTKEFMFRQ